ncbi:dynein intermediate chain 3, ciliary-like [Trichoplusia ni]|uniref:Dynein intermediate chain 3, ciliary-like n=1 Tax=Trichoplusia ni TaxID=7111 RepID=A0A7E5V9J0_TRINI|nr:dynein intermediate chain 3, ciliary-like [Trichoplusia ni]
MDILATDFSMKRCLYGRQPLFNATKPELLDSIEPDRELQRQFGLRNPVHSSCQVSKPMSEHIMNTIRVETRSQGINHCEGGWPKDVNHKNEEETIRYRKRVERDDHYVRAITRLAPKFEYFIHQNNAIEIYQQYFKDIDEQAPVERPTVKVTNLYRDPQNRPIADISWTNEEDPKVVVCYCDRRYPITGPVNENVTCCLWDLENADMPSSEFYPPAACWKLACSSHPSIIVGGLENGKVCVFDRRAERVPVAISSTHSAHHDPVTALLFIQSRTSTEFFTGSSDGQCMWYDTRDLSEPISALFICPDLPVGRTAGLNSAHGISALQFERSFPTRFLCGTETGMVINVNRKGKTPQEVLSAPYKAHKGPVRAVHRSPCTSKMFITCGDWTTHIWSDDIRSSPIITGMPHRYQVKDVVWTPQRHSGFMTVSSDGKFRYWDLLRRRLKPIVSLPVSQYSLYRIVPHEEGRLVSMGGRAGILYLVSLSDDLVLPGDTDKQLMIQHFERETHREHILENRIKEIRLKIKADAEHDGTPTEEPFDEEAAIKACEDDFKRIIIDEFRRAGVPVSHATTAIKTDAMRHR